MSEGIAQIAPAHCENCGTPLQGHYCHACGQSVHSPTRHFGHALEEFFESFWHLDGRVFRSLRDLLVPGRIARNYLAGRRASYLPPLRLFLILSLLTFFIAQLTIDIESGGFKFNGRDFDQVQTEAEVVAMRDAALKKLEVEEREAHKKPGFDTGLVMTRARIQAAADARIVTLHERAKNSGTPAGSAAAPAAGHDASPAGDQDTAGSEPEGPLFSVNGKAWDEHTNPVHVTWLPGFVNRWINHKMARAESNIRHMQGEPRAAFEAVLGALPTALFLLMPVFALLLKVCYLGSGRRYLEHLVVALYSHAFLLIALLVLFLLSALSDAPGLATPLTLVMEAVWVWIPIYLFLTQKRVYGERWAPALLRYFVIGSIYTVLVVIACLAAVVAGLSH